VKSIRAMVREVEIFAGYSSPITLNKILCHFRSYVPTWYCFNGQDGRTYWIGFTQHEDEERILVLLRPMCLAVNCISRVHIALRRHVVDSINVTRENKVTAVLALCLSLPVPTSS
jgi:hypothetical protein